ncbi:MAG: hypothetical protein Q8M20_18040 [Rhodocyclaceae bacterium]|nr:hypothetical protein [Rhodocyclaceae bacterium]
MKKFTEDNPITAIDIFNDIKRRLRDPAKQVVTTNDAQVEFNNCCFEFIADEWCSPGAIDKAIELINNYYDVKISDQ